MNIEELLLQLDSFCQNWPFLYLGRNHASIQLRAIGVGSNKQKQERAGRLASALAALLHESAHMCALAVCIASVIQATSFLKSTSLQECRSFC